MLHEGVSRRRKTAAAFHNETPQFFIGGEAPLQGPERTQAVSPTERRIDPRQELPLPAGIDAFTGILGLKWQRY